MDYSSNGKINDMLSSSGLSASRKDGSKFEDSSYPSSSLWRLIKGKVTIKGWIDSTVGYIILIVVFVGYMLFAALVTLKVE